ncbi:hypothetical protein C8Q76DRAFT_803426 [Earliella scabrosa]|nr:hypothetical protein C8Q76DRAFT_803426 [Earliella scabrosa]
MDDPSTDFDNLNKAFGQAIVLAEGILDVSTIKADIIEVNVGFQTISDVLVDFDNGNFLDSKNQPLQLGPQWRVHWETFVTIVEESGENALAMSTTMQLYTTVLDGVQAPEFAQIPTEEMREILKELLQELQQYRKKLPEGLQMAENARKAFEKLAGDIRNFSYVLKLSLDKAGIVVAPELECVRKKLEDLEKRFTGESRQYLAKGIRFECYRELETERAALEEDERRTKERYNQLISQDVTLQRYLQNLDFTKHDIGLLAARIDTFRQMWNSMRVDLTILQGLIEDSIASGHINRFSQKKVAAVCTLYKTLSVFLRNYVAATYLNLPTP